MESQIVTPGGECVPLQFILTLDHPTLEPRHFVDEKAVNEHYQDYMFLDCIKFINEVGKLHTHFFTKVQQACCKSFQLQYINKKLLFFDMSCFCFSLSVLKQLHTFTKTDVCCS